MAKVYKLKSKVWLYPGMKGQWYFVSVPKKESDAIRVEFGKVARGWGSHRVEVKVGKAKWRTSIFPESKTGVYLLPLKAAVRKSEGIFEKDEIAYRITILS